jgi:hypothetical protein
LAVEAWGWGGSFVAGSGILAGVGGWVGLGWVVEARVWVGVFFFTCLFYIISCFVCLIRNFVCLIRCFEKTTLSLFNLLIGYLLLIRWQLGGSVNNDDGSSYAMCQFLIRPRVNN